MGFALSYAFVTEVALAFVALLRLSEQVLADGALEGAVVVSLHL
jgi:hypothetical protein